MTDSLAIETDALSRMMVDCLQEILGKAGLKELTTAASINTLAIESLSALQWSSICKAAVVKYGLKGSQGLILRTGRIFFKDLLRLYGHEAGIGDLPFRMLPKPKRIRTGIEELARYFYRQMGLDWELDENGQQWTLRISHIDWKQEIPVNQSALVYFAIGMLQEFLAWISGGKVYPINLSWNEQVGDWQINITKQYIS